MLFRSADDSGNGNHLQQFYTAVFFLDHRSEDKDIHDVTQKMIPAGVSEDIGKQTQISQRVKPPELYVMKNILVLTLPVYIPRRTTSRHINENVRVTGAL